MTTLLTPYDAIYNRFFGLPQTSAWNTHDVNDEITQEADGSYKLTVEVPGFGREHVSLTTKGTQLVITLQRQEKDKKTLTYRIGSKVDQSAITATCKDGILTVLCPVKASEQARDIPVS
jgi:HSP20 family molecular chaperone IbpA